MDDNRNWYNLDNQANIYPAVSDKKNTNVYRLTCTLKEIVVPEILQQALDKTLPSFSYYQMIMRRGLFWFYLEPTKEMPIVKKESERPCNKIFDIQVKSLLFNVTYYNQRINIEVFHALADGGGAMEFFRAIVYNYLTIKHEDDFKDTLPVLERQAVPAAQAEDSFKKYYTQGAKDSNRKSKKAFLLGGSFLPNNTVQIISVNTPTKEILAFSKAKGTTLTGLLTALTICAIGNEMMIKRYISRDVSVNVPVDLRSMFPSQTFRNFFSVVEVRYNFEKSENDLEKIIQSVNEQLKEKITKENLVKTLNYNISIRENVFARVVPLFIKNRVLKAFYSSKESTATTTLSNVGRVKMPEELVKYIADFSCLLNPTSIHKVKLCITSFEDNMSLNFTSRIGETSVQKYIVRYLSSNGVNVRIITNGSEKNEAL